MSQNHEVLKVLVLGDPATGKTSMIKRYVHNFFSNHHRTTVGVDFALKQLTVGSFDFGGVLGRVERPVSESASRVGTRRCGCSSGTSRARTASAPSRACGTAASRAPPPLAELWKSQVYYKDAFGAFLVYDISRPETFKTIVARGATVDERARPPFSA